MLDILRKGGLAEYLEKTGHSFFPGESGGAEGRGVVADQEKEYPCAEFSQVFSRKRQTGGILQ